MFSINTLGTAFEIERLSLNPNKLKGLFVLRKGQYEYYAQIAQLTSTSIIIEKLYDD